MNEHPLKTVEKLNPAIRVAYHLTGVGTIYTAAQGLRELVAETEQVI